MRKILIPITLILFCGQVIAQCTGSPNCTVKAGGGGGYTTIQACATAMANGDTCTVYAGTYNETPSIPAGGVGSYKTITVNGNDVVSVLGFTLNSHTKLIGNCPLAASIGTCGFSIQNTSSPAGGLCISIPTTSTDIYLVDNSIYACGDGGSMLVAGSGTTGASFIVIDGNTFTYGCSVSSSPNTCRGMLLDGSHFLIQNNDISHVSDGITLFASFTVYRHNTVHDLLGSECGSHSTNCHIDEIESEPNTASQAASHDNFYERNSLLRNNGSGSNNNHEWLTQGDACGSSCGHMVARFNLAAHVGVGAGDSGGQGLLDDLTGYANDKLYNNTEAFIGAFNNGCNTNNDFDFDNGNINGAVLNTVYYFGVFTNSCSPTYQMAPYIVNSSASSGFRSGYNLAFDPNSTLTLFGPITTDTGSIKNVDPLFTNVGSDIYTLQSSSPARNAGGSLTTVNGTISGSTTLVVNDARVFQDSLGLNSYGVRADCISVTTIGNRVCIAVGGINYSTNTITLVAPISATNGDSVWIYSISDGTIVLTDTTAPDMGAFPFSTGSGSANGSRVFNGTSDFITIPGNGTTIDIQSQAITISAFVYFPSIPATTEMEPLSKADTGATQYEIYINAAGQPAKTLGVYVRQNTSLNHDVFMNCSSQAVVGWNSIVATYSSTLTVWNVYCQGVLANSGTTGAAAVIQSNHDNLLFGKKASSTPTFCNCSLANVTILANQYVTALQAKSLASGVSPLTLFPPPIVAGYWPLWGSSGTNPEPDLSLNGNSGILTGTTIGGPCPCLPVTNP